MTRTCLHKQAVSSLIPSLCVLITLLAWFLCSVSKASFLGFRNPCPEIVTKVAAYLFKKIVCNSMLSSGPGHSGPSPRHMKSYAFPSMSIHDTRIHKFYIHWNGEDRVATTSCGTLWVRVFESLSFWIRIICTYLSSVLIFTRWPLPLEIYRYWPQCFINVWELEIPIASTYL